MVHDYQTSLFGSDDSKLIIHMKEHNITKNVLEDSLNHLKRWFKMQSHLPQIQLEDRFLISMLCFNGYSIEKSKSKIDNLFTARSVTPEFFTNRDPCDPEIIKSMNTVQWVVIPKCFNKRIVIVRFTGDYVNTYDPITSFKIAFMGSELRMLYETTFCDEFILDCAKLKLEHVLRITPSILKKALYVLQNCYSSKIKAIHAVNVPNYAISLINLLKATLKKKIADRVKIHQSLEHLHKSIDADCLPKELGGTAGNCEELADKLMNIMQSKEWRKRLVDSEFERSDESKRIDNVTTKFTESMGIAGSFRKLDID